MQDDAGVRGVLPAGCLCYGTGTERRLMVTFKQASASFLLTGGSCSLIAYGLFILPLRLRPLARDWWGNAALAKDQNIEGTLRSIYL